MVGFSELPPDILLNILHWSSSSVVSLWKAGDKQLTRQLLRGGCKEITLFDADGRSSSRWPKLIGSGLQLTSLDITRFGYVAYGNKLIEELLNSLPKTLQSLKLNFECSLDFVALHRPFEESPMGSEVCVLRDLKAIVPHLTELSVEAPGSFPSIDQNSKALLASSLAHLPGGLLLLHLPSLHIHEEVELADLLPKTLTSLKISIEPEFALSWPPNLTFLDSNYSIYPSSWSKLPKSITSYTDFGTCDPSIFKLLPLTTVKTLSITQLDDGMDKSELWESWCPTSLTSLTIHMERGSTFDLRVLPQTITKLAFSPNFKVLERRIKAEAIASGAINARPTSTDISPEEVDFEGQQLMALRKDGKLDVSFWPRSLRVLHLHNTRTSDDASSALHIHLLPPSLEKAWLGMMPEGDATIEISTLFPRLQYLYLFSDGCSAVLNESSLQCERLEELSLAGRTVLESSVLPKSLRCLKLDNGFAEKQTSWLREPTKAPPALTELDVTPSLSFWFERNAPIDSSDFTNLPTTLVRLTIRGRSLPLEVIPLLPPTIKHIIGGSAHAETMDGKDQRTFNLFDTDSLHHLSCPFLNWP